MNILSHLAHFKSYIWLNLGTKFIANITEVIWTSKQITNSKPNVFWIPFLLLEFEYNYLKILFTCALVTYTKFKSTRGYYNKLWSCWPLSFWKQLHMPTISCINCSQLSQEHSTNPCHKCIAVYQIFFQQLNYSQT